MLQVDLNVSVLCKKISTFLNKIVKLRSKGVEQRSNSHWHIFKKNDTMINLSCNKVFLDSYSNQNLRSRTNTLKYDINWLRFAEDTGSWFAAFFENNFFLSSWTVQKRFCLNLFLINWLQRSLRRKGNKWYCFAQSFFATFAG